MEDRRRRFIFDEDGNKIGYQCAYPVDGGICGALIPTAAGFFRHMSRVHGVHKQMEIPITPEDNPVKEDDHAINFALAA